MEEEPTTSAGSNAELFIRALEYKQLVTKMRRSSLAATRDMKPGRIRKVDKFETENPSVPGDRKLSYKIDRSESKLECKLSPTMKTATFLITGKAWERKLIKSPLPTSEYEGKSSLSIKTEKISSKVKLLQGTPTTAPSKSVWVRGKKEESPTVDTSCPELTVQLKRVGFKKAIVPVERLCLIDYEFTSCDSLTVEMEKTLIKFVR